MKRICTISILLIAVFLAGCVPSEEEETVEKTALITFTEYFCDWTEQSEPFAYFQFAYQENGEIKYINTKTSCNSFSSLEVPKRNPIIIGEQLKLTYEGEKVIRVTRENGQSFDSEESEMTRNFFVGSINAVGDLDNFVNSHSERVFTECLLIKDEIVHDSCLSYQAALTANSTICDYMNVSANGEQCRNYFNSHN